MKLLFAIKSLDFSVGGAKRVFCTICSELSYRGHDVIAVTFNPTGTIPFYPLDSRVRLVNLAVRNPSKSAGFVEMFARMRSLRRVVS